MIEALAGDQLSYRQFLAALAPALRGYFARRLGAVDPAIEDLVQETLLAVHARRFTYDQERPLTAWLNAIARYKLIDHLRQGRTHRTVPLDDAGGVFAEDAWEAAGARIDVTQLLGGLPEGTRGYIRAVKIDGRTVAEVSAASGVSESAVKVAIHRGLKRLALRLKGNETP